MPIDYSEYPPNWHEISEYIRYVRAENKCETCGAPNGELIYRPHGDHRWKLAPEGHEADAMALDGITFVKVVLTVAHIRHDKSDCRFYWFKYIPGDPTNNLVAECQRCHLLRDSKLHARNRKYGRHHNRKEQLRLEL